ncbi:hypothetical protein Tco_0700103 [Tanacetum coccineum]
MKGYQKDDMTNRGGLSKSEVSQGRTPKMKSRMRIKMRKTTKKRKLAQDEEKEVDYEFLRQNNIQSIDWKTGVFGGYRATAPGYYQRNSVNPSYQERRQSMEDTLCKFMSELVKRHEENSNLIKEIRAMTDAAIRNQGASIKTLEIQIGQMRKVLQERGFRSLPSSTETNLRDQVKLISTTIEADSYSIRRIGSS